MQNVPTVPYTFTEFELPEMQAVPRPSATCSRLVTVPATSPTGLSRWM